MISASGPARVNFKPLEAWRQGECDNTGEGTFTMPRERLTSSGSEAHLLSGVQHSPALQFICDFVNYIEPCNALQLGAGLGQM